jgi:hypothetical protein
VLDVRARFAGHHEGMAQTSSFPAQVLSCWNWKCALVSASARSAIYLAAMARTGARGSVGVVLVEIAYVALTSGLFAGLQQKALRIRSRLLGSGLIVLGVPWLAQSLDWLTHRLAGAPAPARATIAVLSYATISALFHLYVMRRGAFLTGSEGRSLRNDLRRVPRLMGGFVIAPVLVISAGAGRLLRIKGAEAAY